MAWISVSPQIGQTAPGNIDATQSQPIGTLARFRDPIYGEGEFIYLPGVVSTAAGDVISFTTTDGATNTGSTTRWAGTANANQPLAVASAAIGAGQWGWYQVNGAGPVNSSGTVTAGQALYWQATATVSSTAVASKQVTGMVAASANGVPSANKTVVQLDRPSAQGAIT
jgi:hypothetical protein